MTPTDRDWETVAQTMVHIIGDDGARYAYKEDELELIPEFEAGEEVEVRNPIGGWHKREYLGFMDGKHWCYQRYDEESATVWPQIRKVKQPEIDITVKINGKEAKLSDISEDTLKKIREAE